MKWQSVLLTLTVLSGCRHSSASSTDVSSANNVLSGKSYSRTFATAADPITGRPASDFKHVLKFSMDGVNVSDNSSTFFGNPVESGTYTLEASTLTLVLTFSSPFSHTDSYTVTEDFKTLISPTGFALNLE